jgi:hypothetical protein
MTSIGSAEFAVTENNNATDAGKIKRVSPFIAILLSYPAGSRVDALVGIQPGSRVVVAKEFRPGSEEILAADRDR